MQYCKCKKLINIFLNVVKFSTSGFSDRNGRCIKTVFPCRMSVCQSRRRPPPIQHGTFVLIQASLNLLTPTLRPTTLSITLFASLLVLLIYHNKLEMPTCLNNTGYNLFLGSHNCNDN